ncbi:MAG TPA: hypothetical protein VMT53_17455 [Terriglobales bacterium]|nr:hypothetical protein [Terriglobales bacterium]
MFARILETLFGCWHTHMSFPITAKSGVRRNAAAFLTGTYVVCLDCGKEFAYDWHEMKVISGASRPKASVRDLATKEAA